MSQFSKEFLDEQKQALTQRRAEILEDLQSFARKNPDVPDDWITAFPDIGDDEDENAQEITTYINDLPVEYTLETELKKVNEALAHIQKGTYGQCKNCNATIDEKRLEAYPEAGTCLTCAN